MLHNSPSSRLLQPPLALSLSWYGAQVRMRFDVEQGEYVRLAKPDAAFPMRHFSMLADAARNQVLVPPAHPPAWVQLTPLHWLCKIARPQLRWS